MQDMKPALPGGVDNQYANLRPFIRHNKS
jgi:hypothetical protein